MRVDYWASCEVSRTNYTVRINNSGATQIVTGFFTGVGDQGTPAKGSPGTWEAPRLRSQYREGDPGEQPLAVRSVLEFHLRLLAVESLDPPPPPARALGIESSAIQLWESGAIQLPN